MALGGQNSLTLIAGGRTTPGKECAPIRPPFCCWPKSSVGNGWLGASDREEEREEEAEEEGEQEEEPWEHREKRC